MRNFVLFFFKTSDTLEASRELMLPGFSTIIATPSSEALMICSQCSDVGVDIITKSGFLLYASFKS